ncbi:DUF4255 domain-containing protein [Negadavirga shengliensis]|uniref:DUF4255 domain-containing protein n=1 Tax=Negadavirga shengliensis TaxID=1389218 RepID=A0ABV9T5Z9_9BACT
MISEAATFIRDEVQRYLMTNEMILNRDQVMLGNIALLESQEAMTDKLILSIVNIEEESTLKNGQNYLKNPVKNSIETIQPPVYLNLYILFTATLSSSDNSIDISYQSALRRISSVIEFFQSKKIFTLQNSPGFSPTNVDSDDSNFYELRLIPELFTLTFEQINHLWGSLGGKQSPFVLYKIRLVKIQGQITAEVPLIEAVRGERKDLFAEKLEHLQGTSGSNDND